MNLNNIFGRNNQTQVRVPEIEVQGDELRVQPNDQGQEQEHDFGEQNQETRSYRLPKTKWF